MEYNKETRLIIKVNGNIPKTYTKRMDSMAKRIKGNDDGLNTMHLHETGDRSNGSELHMLKSYAEQWIGE